MLDRLSFKQKNGLERAKYQYTTARKLGHNETSSMAGAVAAYRLECGDSQAQAEIIVPRFLAIEPEIVGGVL